MPVSYTHLDVYKRQVEAYIHGGGRIGVLVEVNCETDFVAKTDEFKAFCSDIAMQIAAASPEYVRREEVPEHVLERERHIARQQAINDGKPEKILDKIVEGRIEKFYKEVCLMEQAVSYTHLIRNVWPAVGILCSIKAGQAVFSMVAIITRNANMFPGICR